MSEFDDFWKAYPRRVGKLDAMKAYVKARTIATAEDILAGVELYKQHKPEYADWCHPSTFLNKGRWMDEYDTASARETNPTQAIRLVEPLDVGANVSMRAKAFCNWYGETHRRLFGVGYFGTQNDEQHALRLVAEFTDAQLRDAALVWFGQDDDFATKGTRTIAKFASRVTGCLQVIRERGIA